MDISTQYNLPKGWAWTMLKDIADIKMGQSPPSSTYNTNKTGLPFYQGKADFGEVHPTPRMWCAEPKTIARKDSILISVRAPVGPTNIASEECCFGRGLASIEPLSGIHNMLVFYYLRHIEEALSLMGSGSTFQAINQRHLESIPFPLPPTNEQKRIVNQIEQLRKQTAEAKKSLDKLPNIIRSFRQNVLSSAFSGKLVEQDPSDEDASILLEKIALKQSTQQTKNKNNGDSDKLAIQDVHNLPELPRGWRWSTLGQIAVVQRGRFSHRPRNAPQFYGGKYPFIQTGDITNSNGLITTFRQTLNEKGLAISKMFKKGTVLIAIAANIGDSAILNFDACVTDSVVGVNPYAPISSEYVEYYLRTRKSELENSAPATAQKNINLRILNPLPIPIAPLNEQRRMLEKIKDLFDFAQNASRSIDFVRGIVQILDKSIFAKAFRGELVPQDPNDEPASVLLDKLKKN